MDLHGPVLRVGIEVGTRDARHTDRRAHLVRGSRLMILQRWSCHGQAPLYHDHKWLGDMLRPESGMYFVVDEPDVGSGWPVRPHRAILVSMRSEREADAALPCHAAMLPTSRSANQPDPSLEACGSSRSRLQICHS